MAEFFVWHLDLGGSFQLIHRFAKPEALNGVLGCKTLSPKRSVGLQHPKPQKECWVAEPWALNGVLVCKALSVKRSAGLQNLKR